LSEFLADGVTILMATPYLDEAERCSRVALLHEGRLVAIDDPSRLRASFPGRIFEVVAQPYREAIARLAALPEVMDVQAFGERAHVRLLEALPEPGADWLARRLREADFRIISVRAVPASLEDVFIERIT
jgi:ABC-2 type transport system ATP-binding protein